MKKEDVDFLIELQHELNTQDHVCQADPRFWVVAGTVKEGCPEGCGDGVWFIGEEGVETVCDDEKDLIDYLIDNFAKEENNVLYFENNKKTKRFTFESNDYCNSDILIWELVSREYANEEDISSDFTSDSSDLVWAETDWDVFCDTEDLLSFFVDNDIIPDYYSLAEYRNENHIYPDTLFLTNRGCKEHIEANYYHYAKDAHSYAMTAWRSPEVERVWRILSETDWSKFVD